MRSPLRAPHRPPDPSGNARQPLAVPAWVPAATLLLAIVGLGVSTYLTVAHFDEQVSLVCSGNGTINCAKVTTSPQSSIIGIPVAVLGLAYYVGMLAVQWPSLWRSPDPRVRIGRLIYTGAGLVFVLWLVYAELALIGAICIWCTAVHIITFLLFCLTLVTTILTAPSPLGADSDLDWDDEELADAYGVADDSGTDQDGTA